MNGTNKQINRALIFALAIGGVAAVNINSASAAPGPKPIVRAAPSPTPAPAPKAPPIPALIAKPAAPPTSPPPLATVTQLPSFMPWTVVPTPVKTPPPVEQKKDNDGIKITLSNVANIGQALLGITYIVAGKLQVVPIATPNTLMISGLITAGQVIPGSIGTVVSIVGAGIGFLSLYGQASS